MFNKIKSKSKLLILTLIPMLFSLTGCQLGSPKYATFKLTGNWGEWIDYSLWCLSANFTQTIDKFAVGLKSLGVSTILSVVTNQETSSIQTLLGYNDNLVTLMNVVSILACAFILINFAKGIYKNNFATADNQYAPTVAELIKKVVVALILTIAIPYICVTGFTVSSKLGSAAAVEVTSNNGEGADSYQAQLTRYQIFDEMENIGLSYTTVCKTEASKKPDDYIDKKDLSTLSDKIGNAFGESVNSTTFWCGDAETVGDHLMNDKLSNKYLADVISSNTISKIDTSDSEASNDFLIMLSGLLGVVFYVALTVIVSWSIAKRIVDLIVLIAMSWWYIAGSVGEGGQSVSLPSLWKKLLSICLSQFFLLFELGLLQTFGILSDISLSGIIRALAWLAIITGTPTAVEGMVTSTGAGADLTAAGGAVGKGIKGYLSKFRG